jgi:octaprenyl-diphosphate synthase
MTTTLSAAPAPTHDDVFEHLEGVCAGRGLDSLAGRLLDLRTWLAGDLAEVERALSAAGAGDTLAHKSARHLLDQDGKLVHNATLLHDDVVDVGDLRRGSPAARVIYGNAASIFGGDWLLIDALGRIQAAGQPEVMERMLAVIKQMVLAESLQLARRGKVRASQSEYFRIIDGKTASLFRWAMFAGARAGGVPAEVATGLEEYGHKLGVAFQLVDDLLDFAGDAAATGKSLLADLREGKITYPLILAMERDAELGPALARSTADDAPPDPEIATRIARAMEGGGVVEDCLALATRLCNEANKSLSVMPAGRARAALESVALATPRRRK